MEKPSGVGGRSRSTTTTTIVVPALMVFWLEISSSRVAAFQPAAGGGLRRHRAARSHPSFGLLRAEADVQATGASASSTSRPRPPREAPEPDLFEYFDPLLSPHAYPNGIVPPSNDKQALVEEDTEDSVVAEEAAPAAAEPATIVPAASWATSATVPGPASSSTSTPPAPSNQVGDDPLRMDRLQFLGVSHPDAKQYKKEDYDQVKLDNLNFLGVGTGQSAWPRDEIGLPVVDTYASVFDPTVSPHKYPQGTPTEVLSTRRNEDVDDASTRSTVESQSPSSSIVGILLIDHGSKNDSSNQRLHDMASWYQECVQSVAVEAAHMEIASPSIKEGMAKLIERGAEEIVCHPYFLGSGRHVSEDIPRLIEQAMDELDVEVPVRTTAHVGSDMSMMLEAIHALVKQSSTLLTRSRGDRS